MVTELGNAIGGYAYPDAGRPDLPYADGKVTTPHKPWCSGCKRTDRELNVDQRCEQCARAVVTRAAQKERWAAAEKLEASQARTAPVQLQRGLKLAGRRYPSPLIEEVGVTCIQVKEWALAAGLITEIRRGKPAKAVIAAYAAAHPRGEVA